MKRSSSTETPNSNVWENCTDSTTPSNKNESRPYARLKVRDHKRLGAYHDLHKSSAQLDSKCVESVPAMVQAVDREHSPDWMMDTALHLYARCGRADAARMQLRHGADTEICSAQGFTPLLLAARYNQLEVLQVLLQHGARTDALAPLENDFGHGVELGTCVHFAAESGHVQILKFLMTAAALNADEYTRGSQGITPLHLAARLGRADVVRFLVARTDVDVNARDARGMTPLHHACDYPNTVDDEMARVRSRSPPQYLFDAAHVEVVNALVNAGAVLDARRTHDWATPIRCALQRGHFLVAKTLVDHGAYSGVTWWLHKVKTAFSTPLWARHASDLSLKRSKKKQQCKHHFSRSSSVWDTEPGSSFRELSQRHESALHTACKCRSLRRLREILKGQGDVWVNSRVSSPVLDEFAGWTALHIAASSGWQAGLVLLIAHGAKVDLTVGDDNEDGTTALHLAAQNGHRSSVMTLLDAGADIHARDDLGDTPLLRALRHGRSRIVKLLLRHGARCESPQYASSPSHPPLSGAIDAVLGSFDPRKTSSLHLAAFFGLLPVVQELVKFSSLFSLDAVDDDGATPLWLAALMGHLNIVDVLAQQGANLYHHVSRVSATDCAAEFGHLEVLEYLSTSSPGRQAWGRRSLTRLAMLDKSRPDYRNSV
ncbi:unnamed protein product [Phytophthora lilii]|uniref:Unnamed protein product n=1 Tax=Phytophthora lilii TaxID=2077276 RepID=A0A9W6TUN8_9STRA|nr:unnamed protein product [Phytophthora lilii]